MRCVLLKGEDVDAVVYGLVEIWAEADGMGFCIAVMRYHVDRNASR
jgi:hypothetical protein